MFRSAKTTSVSSELMVEFNLKQLLSASPTFRKVSYEVANPKQNLAFLAKLNKINLIIRFIEAVLTAALQKIRKFTKSKSPHL